MKKIYSAMALAFAVGVSANASVIDYTKSPVTMSVTASDFQQAVEDENVDMPKRVKRDASATRNDILGYQMGMYVDLFGEGNNLSENSYQVVPSDKEGYVKIYGFHYDLPVEAKLDEAHGTLTISKQFGFYNSYYKKDIYWTPVKYNEASKTLNEVDAITFHYEPNGQAIGTSSGGEIVFKPGWLCDWREALALVNEFTADGFNGWMGRNNMMIFPFKNFRQAWGFAMDEVFEYNASEWKTVNGKASFTDGWVAPLSDNSVAAYDLDVQVNIKNPSLVLLKNPYGQNTPWVEANADAASEGAIILNIANPEVVKVYPFVYSGFARPVFFNDGYSRLFAMNQEGEWAYLYEWTDEEIQMAIDAYEYEPSTLNGNVVRIPSTTHSFQFSLTTPEFWTFYDDNDQEEVVTAETVIELPQEAIDGAGVEGVTDDVDVNAPKRFYNMQGVEVVNPAAGELVIVKQGSKATKVIVK